MTAPPARNTLSGTPTNAQFNAGIGALYDYIVGLLGAAGTPAAARAALDAVGLTGDQTIGGVKRFTSNVTIGPNAPATSFDIQTTGVNVLTTTWTTGAFDPNFRLGAANGVAGDAPGTSQGRIGLFYMGQGDVAAIDFRRGAGARDGSIAFRTNGADRATLSNSGNLIVAGTVFATAFSGDGSQLTGINVVPTGAVMHFAMNSPPTGWLRANGAAVSRATFAALFAAIGTTYGAGDGSTTFNLPDLRGEFLRGWDDGRGVDSGRGFGTGQSFAQQNITGGFDLPTNTAAFAANASGVFSASGGSGGMSSGAPAGTVVRVSMNTSTHVLTAAEVRPRNIAMLACIKF